MHAELRGIEPEARQRRGARRRGQSGGAGGEPSKIAAVQSMRAHLAPAREVNAVLPPQRQQQALPARTRSAQRQAARLPRARAAPESAGPAAHGQRRQGAGRRAGARLPPPARRDNCTDSARHRATARPARCAARAAASRRRVGAGRASAGWPAGAMVARRSAAPPASGMQRQRIARPRFDARTSCARGASPNISSASGLCLAAAGQIAVDRRIAGREHMRDDVTSAKAGRRSRASRAPALRSD